MTPESHRAAIKDEQTRIQKQKDSYLDILQ
jgi:hypothetical protein